MNRHLSDDELLDRLYGLEDKGIHLENCGECSRRWSVMRGRREELAASPKISNNFLGAQRRAIYSRLDEGQQHAFQNRLGVRNVIPAVALAGLLAIGFLVYRPAAPVPVAHVGHGVVHNTAHTPDVADAELFSDVYAMEQSTEPQAALAIHALFEGDQ